MALTASLVIRSVHVLAMALLFGGAVLTWAAFRTADEPPAVAAVAYEWLFWAGAGLLVLTGVGNLAALGPAVPGAATTWGMTFVVKLVGVVGLLVGSPARTLAVVRWTARERRSAAVADRLRLAYAVTAGYLLVVVGLAEWLAHG